MKIAKYELKVVHKKKLILTMEDDVDSEELLKIFLKTQSKEEKEQKKKKGFSRMYTMSDVPEYKEISDQWLVAENELTAYRDRCMKEGMRLFTRYFWNLWD